MSILQKNIEKEVAKSKTITSVFGNSDIYLLQRQVHKKTQTKMIQVVLDTNDAELKGNIYNWNIASTGSGISLVGNIRDIIAMRTLPMKATVDATPSKVYAADNASLDIIEPLPFQYSNVFVNRNNAYTVSIEEMSSQANVGREGRRFHFNYFPQLMNPNTVTLSNFSMDITPLEPYYELLTSGRGNGWFYFKEKIIRIDSLSISIASPFENVTGQDVRTIIPILFYYLHEDKSKHL